MALFSRFSTGLLQGDGNSALHPGGILLSGIQKTVLTNLEYLYLRVPRCRALDGKCLALQQMPVCGIFCVSDHGLGDVAKLLGQALRKYVSIYRLISIYNGSDSNMSAHTCFAKPLETLRASHYPETYSIIHYLSPTWSAKPWNLSLTVLSRGNAPPTSS